MTMVMAAGPIAGVREPPWYEDSPLLRGKPGGKGLVYYTYGRVPKWWGSISHVEARWRHMLLYLLLTLLVEIFVAGVGGRKMKTSIYYGEANSNIC